MSTPHCTAEIDLGALAANVALIKAKVNGPEVMAVVKADGYGHGLIPSARAAVAGGATWLATALLSEAIALREAGVRERVLTWLNTYDDRFMECVSRDIDLAVNSVESAKAIANAAYNVDRRARVHVKVDTGLGRNGVTFEDLDALIVELQKQSESLQVVGVMSHFAYADEPTNPTIAKQIQVFKDSVDKLEAAGFELEVKHLSNSAATMGLPDTYFNLVRPGVAMYGVTPGDQVGTAESLGITPVMTLKSNIALLKNVPAGTGLSYAHAYYTKEDTTVALIPAGYSDGVPRAASNKGPVLVGGEKRLVAGRVCMDQFVLDVGGLNVKLGDEVVLFGDPAKGHPSVEEWAAAADTIGYEIITRIGPRVVRDYINSPF
jgi:alanine racemase